MAGRKATMGESEPLWVVLWSDDGHHWWIVYDQYYGRDIPAAYMGLVEAEKRRDEMAAEFEHASYRVVPFVMKEVESTGRERDA